MNRESETEAQRRQHIQDGREGDKIPGFDPAIAPLETDAEAGGSATDQPIVPPRDRKPPNNHASSYGDAMRRPFPAENGPGGISHTTIISLVVIALAIVLAAILLW